MTKTAESRRSVRLHLMCVTPPLVPPDTPAPIEFGLQDRHEVITPGHLQPDGSLLYEMDVVVIHQPETPLVRWRGLWVHGKPSAPFLYLSLRRQGVQPTGWIRRLKVPLPHLSWDQMEALPGLPCFAASISGSGSGTVPLLGDGWTRQKPPRAEQEKVPF